MWKFFKVKASSILVLLVLSLIPFLFIAIFSGEGITIASDNQIGEQIKHQMGEDALIAEIISSNALQLGSVRSVSLPGSNPGKAEFAMGGSGVLVVQYRGLKKPYDIKKVTIIRSGEAEVLFRE